MFLLFLFILFTILYLINMMRENKIISRVITKQLYKYQELSYELSSFGEG